MSSTDRCRPGAAWRLGCMIVLLLALWVPLHAGAQASDSRPEAWLVTYGPGEIYWQRFGHNAIWIRDPALGLDHAFNFGFFDFEQERFFLRFLQGRMLYFSAAQPVRKEFAAYIDENRSIRAQKLDLDAQQLARLTSYLLREVRPEHRDYLYDYYLNNCSTRVRDALDLALDGAISSHFKPIQAPQNWREHTRRLTFGDFWVYLGLEVGLGAPVDRSMDRWQEMFIPGELADAVSTLEVRRDGAIRPLVAEDTMLYLSTLERPPDTPPVAWPRYLLAALVALAIAGLLGRWISAAALARAWFAVSGLLGIALIFLWFATNHAVAQLNLNLLVLSPLWLLLVFWKKGSLLPSYLVGTLSLLALLMPWLPPWQYTLDVLAAFLPLNIAAAWALRRQPV